MNFQFRVIDGNFGLAYQLTLGYFVGEVTEKLARLLRKWITICFCPQCDAWVPAGATSCPECGRRLMEEAA